MQCQKKCNPVGLHQLDNVEMDFSTQSAEQHDRVWLQAQKRMVSLTPGFEMVESGPLLVEMTQRQAT